MCWSLAAPQPHIQSSLINRQVIHAFPTHKNTHLQTIRHFSSRPNQMKVFSECFLCYAITKSVKVLPAAINRVDWCIFCLILLLLPVFSSINEYFITSTSTRSINNTHYNELIYMTTKTEKIPRPKQGNSQQKLQTIRLPWKLLRCLFSVGVVNIPWHIVFFCFWLFFIPSFF